MFNGGREALKYTIDTELSIGNLKYLPEYLRRQYLLQHEKYRAFRDVRTSIENGKHHLSYRVLVPRVNQHVDITVEASVPIEVWMKLSDPSIKNLFWINSTRIYF